jgi:methyl-accepting chemotaxis protein
VKIKSKISSGFGILAALFLLSGVIGLYGTGALKESLNYVTGAAWDTADGAMEGATGIEAEIIGISRTLQRQHPDEPVSELVAEGQATASASMTVHAENMSRQVEFFRGTS